MFHAMKPPDCSLKPGPRANIFLPSLSVAVVASVMLYSVVTTAVEPSSSETPSPSSTATQQAPNTQQAPLSGTGVFDTEYLYSFIAFDACGDYSFGKHFREALIAKVESCPITSEAKTEFYKNAALATNEALSGYTAFLFTHPGTKYIPNKDLHCNDNHKKPGEVVLRTKLAEYAAGKIKLTDVIVESSGKAVDCTRMSREGFEGPASSGLITSGR